MNAAEECAVPRRPPVDPPYGELANLLRRIRAAWCLLDGLQYEYIDVMYTRLDDTRAADDPARRRGQQDIADTLRVLGFEMLDAALTQAEDLVKDLQQPAEEESDE